MKEERCGDDDTEERQPSEPRKHGIGTNKDLELSDEAGETRKAKARERCHSSEPGECRRSTRESAEVRDLIRLGALPDRAGDQEECACDETVCDHLDRCTGKSEPARAVSTGQKRTCGRYT